MNVRLGEKIPPAFEELFWDMYEGRHDEYWLKGGRGSGKSSFVSLMALCLMLKDPEANVMIFRKVAENLRESVLAQMRWAAEEMGLNGYFQYRLNPMEMIYRPTGQRILFRGADDPEKSKGVKLPSGYFALLWFEEASAFRGMEEIRTIQASVLRGKKGATVLSYNPPISIQSWVNAEALNPCEGRAVHQSDYRQMPPEWLGETFLKQAERLKKRDERAYRHMYLGEAVGTGGKVFEHLEVREIPQEERERFPVRYAGLDFGFASDPDALVLCAWDKREKRLLVLDENVQTGQSLEKLAENCRKLAGERIIRCDSAAPREIAELRRRNVNAIGAKKGAGSVEHGIRWLQNRFQIVIDTVRCPCAAREFSQYEYGRDRAGNLIGGVYPDKNNHTIDAVRYALEAVATERAAIVPQ